MIKSISFIIFLLFAFTGYAEEQFRMLQEYDPENEASCSFITKDGKEGVVLNSNLCFFAYKIDMQDLDKAYEIFKKQYKNSEVIWYIPEKAPAKRKDKDKIHVRIIFNGVDYNILFVKKEDGIYVYSHESYGGIREMGKAEFENVNDKLKVSVNISKLVGSNYINKVTQVVVKNVYQYSLKEKPEIILEFEAKTNSMQEAYSLIRDYFISKEYYEEDTLNNIFPKVINENSGYEKINDDNIKINVPIINMEDIKMYTLELKKDNNIIKGFITIDDFGNTRYF